MADREQALRDGVTAARVAALVPPAPHAVRRAPQSAQDRPEHRGYDHDDAERNKRPNNFDDNVRLIGPGAIGFRVGVPVADRQKKNRDSD